MSSLLIAELRARAAQLRLAALRAEQYAYALESGTSRARRNRKKTQDLLLAIEYERLADAYEEGSIKW